jgi:hypothetical protein
MSARPNDVEEFRTGNARLFTEALLQAVKVRAAGVDVRLSTVEMALSGLNETMSRSER